MGQMSELALLVEETVDVISDKVDKGLWFFQDVKTDRLWVVYLVREMEAMLEGQECSEVHIKDSGLLTQLFRDAKLKYKAWDTVLGSLRLMLSGRVPCDPGFVKLVRQFFMLEV